MSTAGGGIASGSGFSGGSSGSTGKGMDSGSAPESRLDASKTAFESSAHARSETVPAHVGDTSTLQVINQLEANNQSAIGNDGKQILGHFAITDGSTSDQINLPTSQDLQTKPIAELRSTLDQNNQKLEAEVGNQLPQLQKHFLGFHGASSSGIDTLQSNAQGGGNGADVYVATTAQRSANAQEWIANTSQALDFATAYAATDQHGATMQGGSVAVIDMGEGSKKGQNYGVELHQPTDTQFWGMAAKAGETVETVDSQANPGQIKGYLDPSQWSDYRTLANAPVTSSESNDRHRLAGGFARQAMITDLLKVLNGDGS